jgi:two-component system NtrC family sensor kinase
MKVRDPGLLKPLKEIRAAAERCARIVKTFLAMARQQQPERSPIQLNEIIHAALKLLDYPLHTSGIEVILDLQPELPQIPADASQIHQVYTNLLVNAQQALLERAAPRRLSITTRYDQRTGQLHSAVSDNGPGIPETVRSRIFDPFFTTKPIGYGTGVGLSFSHGVITAHGGTLNYEASPQGGAGFVIMLPLTAVATPAPAPAAGEPSVPTSRSLQVLIVDDEPEVTEIISDILQQSGHRTMLASSGKHALELLQQQHLFAFDVILSDLQMADINGPELYAQLQQQHPQLSGRIAFITGDTLGAAAAQFLRDSGCPYLEKPFTPAELEQLIATLAASS